MWISTHLRREERIVFTVIDSVSGKASPARTTRVTFGDGRMAAPWRPAGRFVPT
jgi:hypothetical protein